MSDLNRPPILIPFYHLKRFQSSSFFLYSLILQTLSLSTSNHLLLKRSFEKWLNLPMSFMFAMLVMRFLKMICISFFNHLGLITKLVMLRAKNQTLLQMQDVPSAASALQFFTNVEPTIRGRNVYVQFSSHQELTTIEQNIHRREDEVCKCYPIQLASLILHDKACCFIFMSNEELTSPLWFLTVTSSFLSIFFPAIV
ncbi:PREDICTED: uncharacterized protein LOC109125137 [Camelina sativa]|uniref:Uncharacterized protein LOC109125137 n=1 Tax=Camelina sativa TaxID=90675 RepID=A0ABM1QGN3_CAMSA|nr:PREDICTED: uncharacterized protein LOC109125137 [Camelina sativa]